MNGVNEYVGMRYVPKIAEPAEWDSTRTYESLMIVTYQGNSYTSRMPVPAGIPITDTHYWALTGNYNAQIEQYRQQVLQFDGRIAANTDANTAQDAQLAGTSDSGLKTLIQGNTSAIGNLQLANEGFAAQLAGTSDSGLKTLIQSNTDAIGTLGQADEGFTAQLAGTSDSGLKTLIQSNASDIDALEESVNEKGELVFIGDSWGTQNDGVLPNHLGKRLNCKVHSYAVSGTGFIQGTTNFQVQAQSAFNDATINASKVRYIVIVGGSNDFSHGYTSSADINNAINAITNLLLPKFKNATVHVAFNTRFKYNTNVWSKLNAQVNLWNNVVTNGTNIGTNVIYHPSSSTWFSKAWFQDDQIHITEAGLKAYALYLSSAISGNKVNPMRTNVTSVSLNAYANVSGTAYMFFDEAELWCDVYLTVSDSVTGTHGIKTDANGLFPIQLFPSPTVNQISNRLGIPCVRTDGTGSCDISIHFTTSDLGDTVYISPIEADGTIPAGHYTGHGRIRLFGNY